MTDKAKPDRAFLLAAGMGKRLRPYTDTLPKPLVPVGGKPIIDHVLDRLAEGGVKDVTVNLHYMADKLESHLARRAAPRITLSHETELLETGGGMKKALATMKGEPFFAVPGDSIWTDGPSGSALDRLAAAWDGDKMDILLLLHPLDRMTLTAGSGDYDIGPDGRPVRSQDKTGAYVWTSVRICHPRVFDDAPDGKFSFLIQMDRAEEQGRLHAIVHDGDWHHISTPADLERVDAALLQQKKTA